MATLKLSLKPRERFAENTVSEFRQSKTEMERVEGIIVWFRNDFGFVHRSGFDNDYFAHKNEFESGYIPKPNDRVNFFTPTGRKLVATQISRSKNEAPKFSSEDFL